MDEFIRERQYSPPLCSYESLSSLFSSVGSYASSAVSTIGDYAGSAAEWVGNNPGTALQYAGTVAQVAGGIQQNEKQAKAFDEQAKAIDTETELAKRAEEHKNRQIIGHNRASAAASGVDPFSGSPLETEFSNAFEGGLNEAMIQWSGDAKKRQAKLGAGYARGQIPGLVLGGLMQGAGIAASSKGTGLMSSWYHQSRSPSSWSTGASGRYGFGNP